MILSFIILKGIIIMANSTLEVILGPMFSGKSTELIRRVRFVNQ